jgi:putative intracellular protease/amidase
MSDKSIHIVFPLFDGMAALDFVAPHQAFSVIPDARITVASVGGRNIDANGLVFSSLADLSKIEGCDVLCIPGGFGTAKAMVDEAFIREIRRLASAAKYQTSVCTGALILGAAGLLRGKRAATYWASRDTLQLFGAIVEKGRVVRDGNIITAPGNSNTPRNPQKASKRKRNIVWAAVIALSLASLNAAPGAIILSRDLYSGAPPTMTVGCKVGKTIFVSDGVGLILGCCQQV